MKKFLILCVLAAVAPAAEAGDFTAIVNEVVGNNPQLAAERASLMSETLQRVAENRLAPTEVSFSYTWPTKAEFERKRDLSVEQSFDWPGTYGARRKAIRSAQSAYASKIAATERDLRQNTTTLLCRIVDANLRCDMLRTIVSNLDSLHGSMHAMLEQRQITELDHRKVALEEVSMKQQLSDAESARAASLAQLAALNGGELPAGSADLREYPAQTLKPLESYLSREDPATASLRSEASTLMLDADAEHMALYPGFSLGYVFNHEGPAYNHGFSVGLTLPSYSAKPRAEAAKLRARTLELQAENAAVERRAAISADYAAALHVEKLLGDYAYAFGHDYPALLKRALVGGQLSYIEYFSELNFYLTARLDYLEQMLNYHTLLTGLEMR